MIYDKAISRVDGVKVIPLATLKEIKKAKKKLNFRQKTKKKFVFYRKFDSLSKKFIHPYLTK